MMKIRIGCSAIAAIILSLTTAAALAQAFPNKPVRIIVAFAPGGPVDVVARLVAIKMQESLGQTVIVENRPSTTGNIGSAFVAKAPPDGYTLLANSSAFAVNVTLTPNAGYDAEKELVPLVQIATQPNLIVVHPGISAKTVAELIALAKTSKLSYASPGNGTTPHLTAENLFRTLAKVNVTHVPYKGAGPAAAAVVAGEPEIGSLAVTAPIPFVRSGRLRALAISSTKRHPALPDVPTLVESGFPTIQDYTWVGLFAPTGTPADAMQKLNASVNRALQQQDVRERLESLLFEPIGGTSEQFADYVKVEIVKWGKVVRDTGAKVD